MEDLSQKLVKLIKLESCSMLKHSKLVQIKAKLSSYYEKSNMQGQTVIYISWSTGQSRAEVKSFCSKDFDRTWIKVQRFFERNNLSMVKYLKFDVVIYSKKIPYQKFDEMLKETPRNNYFRYGIAFDEELRISLLEEEINGNMIFQPDREHKIGKNKPNLSFNHVNLSKYLFRKYKKPIILPDPLKAITIFRTRGIMVNEGSELYELQYRGPGINVRQHLKKNIVSDLERVIKDGRKYLSDQILDSGKFIYGYFPQFNKTLINYNTVRHFSTLYAWLEAVEDLETYEEDLPKIKSGLDWGIQNLTTDIEGHLLFKDIIDRRIDAFEYKLGSNAMVLLAFSKYQEITGDLQYEEILINTVKMIKEYFIQDGDTIHVLNEKLEVKEAFRTVYYDGEVLFGLARAYKQIPDDTTLSLAESILKKLVEKKYYKYHDHWISYAVNELSALLPKEEYYEFGIRNATENLNFINKRDTAYPTMLELLVAAAKFVDHLDTSEQYSHLLEKFPKAKDIKPTMDKRALHEMNVGVFYPEVAMYMAKPNIIAGGFFARHDNFRMRIDDAEHFLSGLINYKNYIKSN